MIGIHTFIRLSNNSFKDNRETLDKEEWHELETVIDSERNALFITKHISYPIIHWEINDYVIVFEGAIFNFKEKEVKVRLEEIVKGGIEDSDIDRFVLDCDGDYIVTIKNKESGETFIFNDILGNIPLNYYYSDNLFVASRSLSYIAVSLPQLEISQYNLAENLTIDYNLLDHTIFKGIRQTMPAQEIKTRIVNGVIETEIRSTYTHYFEVTNPYKNKKEAAKDLARIFIKACQERVEYANEHGYEIVNTMSGGFDSRTVLGGLDKFTHDFLNVTYEYIQDESEVARAVLDKVGSKSEFVKFSYENKPDYTDDRLTLITDGKINCYTNSVCYHDLKYGYDNFFKRKKVLYFGGFGGEFIRHPYFPSVWNINNISNRFLSPSLDDICNVLGVREKENMFRIHNLFKTIEAPTNEAYCKRLYSEYYTKYVRGAGEERMRLFYFTTQPLMAKDFILAARNRIPLRWCGYRFYKMFLAYINPALNEVGVYGNRPNIHSLLSLLYNDYYQKGTVINKLIYRRLENRHKRYKRDPLYDARLLGSYIDSCKGMFTHLNNEFVLENYSTLGTNFQNKILAFLQYVKMILVYRSSTTLS